MSEAPARDPSEEAAAPDWAEAAEQAMLDRMLRLAPLHGWTRRTVLMCGKAEGLSPADVELLLPNGANDLAALLSRRHDARALATLATVDVDSLKIRERIRQAIEARLDAAAHDEPATRRWAGHMALPANLGLASRLAWESADQLWRWAGDVAADENHYTKRTLLAGILTTAGMIRMTAGRAAAMAFADRRIENVMAFEKLKATSTFRPGAFLNRVAQAAGRMRYGAPDATGAPPERAV